ncbi:MAG: heme NO-binding domain-containing protein [Bdellovibrionales bacterium]|nr:heme NO-binding domain-containing protein [Bdellovibrionales bacterium]NQZ19485.1 heme NO-binding domain-containing protein [Bdellovibrionales bacterium]
MKGIVFKELLSMMEDKFGDDLTEEILSELDLDSGGAYTSADYYDHSEILQIVTLLSQKSGVHGADLVKAFGRHLLDTFHKIHPDYFNKDNSIEFMKSVDDYIHVEVKKLYPDAELPKIDFIDDKSGTHKINYSSKRPFADLAEGLIERCIEVFEDDFELEVTDRNSQTQRTFLIKKNG